MAEQLDDVLVDPEINGEISVVEGKLVWVPNSNCTPSYRKLMEKCLKLHTHANNTVNATIPHCELKE